MAPASVEGWAPWLQEQAIKGRIDAIEALRKRAFTRAKGGSASLSGEAPAHTPRLIPVQKIDGVIKRRTVIYDLCADAVRDDGDSFRISAGATAGTDVMALRMAQCRFGNVIFVDGDHAFRSRMIQAAVEGKVFIKFGRRSPHGAAEERDVQASMPGAEEGTATGAAAASNRILQHYAPGLSFAERWNRDMNSARNQPGTRKRSSSRSKSAPFTTPRA